MSAAIRQQPIPLFHEGLLFWTNFTAECRSRIQAINAAMRFPGVDGEQAGREQAIRDEPTRDQAIRFEENDCEVRMRRAGLPSTEILASLKVEPWGPVVNVSISGRENVVRRYATYDLEIPIARDLDGSVVAIFDEGRSFSAADVARYLMQSFHRCFPGIALPC